MQIVDRDILDTLIVLQDNPNFVFDFGTEF